MRHRKAGLKLNRTSSHRKAMFRNMVTSLFKHERIRTTDVRAKELRRWADNLITLAKRGDVHARRQALSIVQEKDVVHKLFAQAPKRYGSVSGGYTRIIKLGRRPGDAAPISLIELILAEDTKKKKKIKKIKKDKTKIETKKVAEKKETEKLPAGEEKKVSEKEVESKIKKTEEKEISMESKETKEIEDKSEDETAVLKSDASDIDVDESSGEPAEASTASEGTEPESKKLEEQKEDPESEK